MKRTGATGAAGRRVGELAAATGLTVRTQHHYEEVGLLVASERSAAGHRLYSDADLERLYRICLLRRLGLGLSETARALDDPPGACGPPCGRTWTSWSAGPSGRRFSASG